MDNIIKEVVSHAAQTAPNECCGLVVEIGGELRYIRCKNIAADPQQRFVIPAEEYASAEDTGKIVMVAHSHVFKPVNPSEADKVGCERSRLPWLIVNHPNGNYTITKPIGYRAPLIGRPFCEGVLDCYELVKDYFALKRGIELPDYVRPEGWEHSGRSILVDNFEAFGFKRIEMSDLQPGDCLLMQKGASVVNHCAVYIGDNMILHHVRDRISGRDVYGGFWRKATTHALRYIGRPE